MSIWKAIVPLTFLSALLTGCCSTSTGGLTMKMPEQTLPMPSSLGRGTLIVDSSSSLSRQRIFDAAMTNGILTGWNTLSISGTRNTVDCKFSYENKDIHEIGSGLTLFMYAITLGTFPWQVHSEITCSAQMVIHDETGKVIKTIQTEKIKGEQSAYISILPTSWLVRLFSRAHICQAGILSSECKDVSEEMGTLLFRAVVLNELNQAARDFPP